MDYLAETYPHEQFTFCLGADSFLDLVAGKWKESDKVLRSCSLLVLHRAGQAEDRLQAIVEATPGARLLHVESLGDMSSTKARDCRDVAQLKEWLEPTVVDYIVEHRLYAFAEDE